MVYKVGREITKVVVVCRRQVCPGEKEERTAELNSNERTPNGGEPGVLAGRKARQVVEVCRQEQGRCGGR